MKVRSITRQTVTIVLIAQVALAIALSSATVLHEWRDRIHALDIQIAGHNDSLLGAIQDAEDPEDNIYLDPQELQLPSEDRYAVYSDSGKLVGRSSQGSLLPQDGPTGMDTLEMDGVRYRIFRRHALRIIDRAEYGGVGLRRPVVMVYAAPETHVLHETVEGVGFSLTSIAIVAVVTALLMSWLIRDTLRPLRDLAEAAQQVSSSSLQFSSPQSVMQVEELLPLSTTLSTLIDELRDSFAKEQRFVGDAAHELKTAVAVVRSAVQLLMMKSRNEFEYIEGLKQILQDNGRVESLVLSMLDLARIEQGPVEVAPAIDLARAATLVCRTMYPLAEQRCVQLVVDTDTNAMVCLYADRAETLLTNLLSNAIQYSAEGGSVTVAVNKAPNGVTLIVVDEGNGIRPEALPHVFERFYRDDPSRSRVSGGTGLGLAICKSIVDVAGGAIDISSSIGSGTRVTVSFRHA